MKRILKGVGTGAGYMIILVLVCIGAMLTSGQVPLFFRNIGRLFF
jgi:hypothetical protein